MRIQRFIATEVVVPAHPNAIDSPGINRPLHQLAVGARPGYTVQFDVVPKLILEMELSNGIVGLGEFYRDHDWKTITAIAEVLLGQDLNSLCRQSLPIPWCREYDGFECAVWDAYAKSCSVRMVDLLGGPVREEVRISAWSGHRYPEDLGAYARRYSEQGYDCLKLKSDLRDDVVAWCRTIAENAPKLNVIIDPNQRWVHPFEVRKRLDALREIGNVMCLEDPIPRWMLTEYARLRDYGAVPIVLHVSLPYVVLGQRVHEAVTAIQMHAVDGFNFNGGLANFQRLDHIAHAANLPCWHGSELDLGVLEAMYVHSCAAAQSCIWPSDIFGRLIRSHDLLKTPLERKPPHVRLPSGPGLGIELDPDALKHYQTKRKEFIQ